MSVRKVKGATRYYKAGTSFFTIDDSMSQRNCTLYRHGGVNCWHMGHYAWSMGHSPDWVEISEEEAVVAKLRGELCLG